MCVCVCVCTLVCFSLMRFVLFVFVCLFVFSLSLVLCHFFSAVCISCLFLSFFLSFSLSLSLILSQPSSDNLEIQESWSLSSTAHTREYTTHQTQPRPRSTRRPAAAASLLFPLSPHASSLFSPRATTLSVSMSSCVRAFCSCVRVRLCMCSGCFLSVLSMRRDDGSGVK